MCFRALLAEVDFVSAEVVATEVTRVVESDVCKRRADGGADGPAFPGQYTSLRATSRTCWDIRPQADGIINLFTSRTCETPRGGERSINCFFVGDDYVVAVKSEVLRVEVFTVHFGVSGRDTSDNSSRSVVEHV